MNSSRKWSVTRVIVTTAYLSGGWLLFTGSVSPRSVLMGVGFSFVVALASFRIFIDDDEAARKNLIPRGHWALLYFLLLLCRMYTASFRTALAVIRDDYSPRVVHFRTRLSSHLARSVVAGSITLIPGTITLELTDDHLVVHWLESTTTHSRHAGEMIKGSLENVLRRVWV